MPSKKKGKRHIRLHYVAASDESQWYAQVRYSRSDRNMVYVTHFYWSDIAVMLELKQARIHWR